MVRVSEPVSASPLEGSRKASVIPSELEGNSKGITVAGISVESKGL